MEHTSNNPATNILGAGVTESDLANAIQRSGYPLQTVIANFLRDNFVVQDEWVYIDKDTKELRTIDILAGKRLFEFYDNPRVRPSINLLIECKQSDLPFVFLLSPTKPLLNYFPVIAGLAQEDIIVTTENSTSTYAIPPLSLLGLDDHKFIQEAPYFSYTFSKGVRKGKDLELSGSESYNSLILPIIKSLLHFQVAAQPPETAVYFDAHLALGVGVLNAPMVGVKVFEKGNEQILLPWVRIIRREYFEDLERWKRSKLFVIDIIHKDFFQEYVEKHVMPFANDFSTLALKHHQVISSGKGFVPNLMKSGIGGFEPRLKPINTKAKISRVKSFYNNIVRLTTGQK